MQLKTILVPLDFSEPSMQALKYTIRLAEKFRAAIHLVHVQPTDELTTIARAGHLMLDCADAIALMQDRLAEIQHRHDVHFWLDNCHVLSGRPFEEVCRLAREIGADLIVLPTRGHGGLRHVVLGSTAERIVRFAPCPVLVLRGEKYQNTIPEEAAGKADFKLRKILVPVDFSKCSLAGARYAARLARSTGASLRFLRVVFPYSQLFGIGRVGSSSASLVEAAREIARAEMAKLKRMKFLRGIDCETEIRVGPTVDEISGESSGPEIDLLVTSTHGVYWIQARPDREHGRTRGSLRRMSGSHNTKSGPILSNSGDGAAAEGTRAARVVELLKVSLNFGEKHILDQVSLAVDRQERLVIIGQSGMGKTTILRLILGVIQPTSGAVLFNGQDLAQLSYTELQEIRTRIGMVYQDAALLSSVSVRQNLALPLEELTKKSAGEINRIVEEKLDLVEMRGEGKTMPFELSGGMRKRVGLARALVMEPEVILFDEPTQGLDPVVSAVIDKLIIDLTARSKVTSIIVTHLMDSAFRVATRMAMLHRGRIVAEGTPEQMRESRNPFVIQFLSGSTEGPMLERSKYHMLSPPD